LHRFDPRGECSRDQVLSLADEEPVLLAVLAVRELAHQLHRRVVPRGDHESSAVRPPGGQTALPHAAFWSSAAFAFSATSANALGSFTARSASVLRSSSIPAAWTPAMKRLYESPLTRAAALMRMIQSCLNVRFLFLRSR